MGIAGETGVSREAKLESSAEPGVFVLIPDTNSAKWSLFGV